MRNVAYIETLELFLLQFSHKARTVVKTIIRSDKRLKKHYLPWKGSLQDRPKFDPNETPVGKSSETVE